MPELIGAARACKILDDIHRTTLTRWVAEGRLQPVSKLPGKNGAFIFDIADVERLQAERLSQAS